MKDEAERALTSLIVFGCVERMLEGGDTNISHAAVSKIVRICIYDRERSKP
jgi:hypothetical protein